MVAVTSRDCMLPHKILSTKLKVNTTHLRPMRKKFSDCSNAVDMVFIKRPPFGLFFPIVDSRNEIPVKLGIYQKSRKSLPIPQLPESKAICIYSSSLCATPATRLPLLWSHHRPCDLSSIRSARHIRIPPFRRPSPSRTYKAPSRGGVAGAALAGRRWCF